MTRVSILSILFFLLLSFLPSCQSDKKTNTIPIDATTLFSGITDSIVKIPLTQLKDKDTDRIKTLILNPPRRIKQISEYDYAIKKTAKKIGWDWRLLASLIHQESHFLPDLESEKGAFGIMQLMPVVMERYEIDHDATPEEQIEVGGKLLLHLDHCLQNKVTDSAERVKFVLAAYNAGLGHVYDAQRLAEKYGKSPDVWTDNVDFFILNKSKAEYYNDTCCRNGYLRGTETYRFVESVLKKHKQYKLIID